MKQLSLIIFIIAGLEAPGQRNNIFSLYDVCLSYYNPALTASDGKPTFYIVGDYLEKDYMIGYRHDIKILKKHDNGFSADLSVPIINGKNKFAIGLNYSEKHFFVEERRNLRLNLTYTRRIRNSNISFGINLDQIKDFSDYRFLNDDSYSGIHLTRSETKHTFNTGLGIAYQNIPSNFYIGFSVNQLRHSNLKYENLFEYYRFTNIYSLNSGIDININRRFKLKPSFHYFRDNYYDNITFAIVSEYKNRLLWGLGYSSLDDNLFIRTGYHIGPMQIHYTFGVYEFAFQSTFAGRHSAGLAYTFKQANKFKSYTFNTLLPMRS